MESRKKRNQEIERQKKQKQRIFTTVLTVLLIAAVAGLGYGIWFSQNIRTVITYRGERIAADDLRLFTTGMPPGEATRQMALDSLLQTLELLHRGEAHRASDTQLAQIIEEQEMATNRRQAELVSAWTIVFEPLMDELLPMEGFPVDEDALEEHLEENMENFVLGATSMYVRYIASQDWGVLEGIREGFEPGTTDFAELIREYCEIYDPAEGIHVAEFMDFMFGYDVDFWNESEALTALEVGEVSHIFMAGQEDEMLFFLVEMYEKEVDYEELENILELQRELFINDARSETFQEMLNDWVEEAREQHIVINNRSFNRF